MNLQSRVRMFAFVIILLFGLVPQRAQAFDPPLCPDQECDYCPANWYGTCWTTSGCGGFGCYGDWECQGSGGTVGLCYCPPCA